MNMIYWLADEEYRKAWTYFKKRKKGEETADYKRGLGFYLPVSNESLKGRIFQFPMKNDKVGVYKLIDYKTCENPKDLTEWAHFMFIGYKDSKPVNECKFEEFLEIYTEFNKVKKGMVQ